MEELSGTAQSVKYVWQARKPFRLPSGATIKQGETFTPTVEMITAYGDLMVRAGAAAQIEAADAKIAAAKAEVAQAEAEKAEARAKAEADAMAERAAATARPTPAPTEREAPPAQPKRPGSRE